MPSPGDLSSDLDLGGTVKGFAAGQRLFDRYILIRILGRGGMGVVWLARDERLEREVALKFLPDLVVYDPAVLEELKRETKRSLALTHHGIVRTHDFVVNAESACISMEYVDGPTLSALRIQRDNNVFQPEELAPWVKQLCEALAYAHERARVVHRDLKPANIMLNSKGEVKVTDFGIARSVSDSMSILTVARGASGTLVYMSPQQLDGERTSLLDDIYSLGVTLYELLSGKPPFYSGNIDRQIREKAAPSVTARRAELGVEGPNAIPIAWEETIAACLAKVPETRPQSAREVSYLLGLSPDYKPLQHIEAKPEPPALGLKPTKNKRVALLVAILVFAGCGAWAGWWFGIEHPRRIAENKRVAEDIAAERAIAEKQRLDEEARAKEAAEKRNAEIAARENARLAAERAAAEKLRLETEAQEKENARLAELKRKREEAEAVQKQREQAEAERRAALAAEAERKAEERRKAEEARIAALPKTITVPSDETTISAAMARAKKGDTIKVRAGTYEDHIIFKEGVKLAGDNCKSVTVRCEATKAALSIIACQSGSISGITFEHTGSAADPSSSSVMDIANSYVEVFDCRIQKGGGFGIVIRKGASPVIHDCLIEHNTWSGVIVDDSGTNPRLKSNQCRDNGQSGVYFLRGSGGLMEKNQCESNDTGISIANDGTNVSLRSNKCSRNRYTGIRFYAGSGGLAEENRCESNRTGIAVDGSGTKPALLSNHCRGNTEFGIAFTAESAGTAEKNECEGNPTGILVAGIGTSVTITGNHCFGAHRLNGLGGMGITVDQGGTGSVLLNTCESNAGAGIWIANGASPSVRGNICRTNGNNGLEFRFASTGAVTDNTCERNVGSGVAVFDQSTSPEIWGNHLTGNSQSGIFVGTGASPRIGQNTINGNGYAPISYENVTRTEGDY
jgi:parallel beta-helix repeat protein